MVSSGHRIKNNKKPKWERGQAFVLIAIGAVALIAVIGLATDATMIYKTKQDLQRALDSASLACAYKLPYQTTAAQAANEFMRLNGYKFSGSPPQTSITITFPNSATKKICHVQGTTNASYYFLRILGFNSMVVSAMGESEAAPMDIYLILDLSESMTYDTQNRHGCGAQSDCLAIRCNQDRDCDPLDTDIKPAANFFIDQLDERYDRVGLVTFNQMGVEVIGLTNDFDGPNGVKAKINAMNAFSNQEANNCVGTKIKPLDPLNSASNKYCAKQTNLGDGILYARGGIANQGRIDAVWSMVLLTDGKANAYRDCDGPGCITNTNDPHCREQGSCCPPNCGTDKPACSTAWLCSDCTEAATWATNNAFVAWHLNETVIYTIAYGQNWSAYQDLLIDISDWTDNGFLDGSQHGQATGNFFAAPNGAALQADFEEIARRIYSRLLQ
jgi:Flp pilus assembly protein TadG